MKIKRLIALITMTALLGASSIIAYAEGIENCEKGIHEPDLEYVFEADYHDCTGGTKVDSYSCKWCYRAVDIDGNPVDSYEAIGPHVVGEPVEMEWTSCEGGYPDPVYECAQCGILILEDGSEAYYVEGDGKHNPDLEGDWFEAQYTECGGGYKDDRFFCKDCGSLVNREGERSGYTEGTGKHVPDLDRVYEANYTECGGGYKEDYYVCKFEPCGTYVNAQGEEMEYIDGEAEHTLEYVAKVEPTVEKEGCKEHWKCTVCGDLYADAEGTERVWDFELVIDRLDKVEDSGDTQPDGGGSIVDVPDDKPVKDDNEKVESDTVKTGDPANTIGYLTAMAATMAAVVGIVLKRRNA